MPSSALLRRVGSAAWFLVPNPAQHSPAQPTAQPKPWCGPCQSSAKGFFLLDSDAPFSAPRRLLFRSVFGSLGAAVPLRFAVLKARLWGLVFGAQPKLSPAPPSPGQPRLAQALVWALPKLCQWLFLVVDSDAAFSAPRRHRFWCVFGSFAAAVPLRFAVLKPRLWGLPSYSPAQPSPGSAKGFFLLDSDAPFSAPRRFLFRSVFGSFGAGVPLRFLVSKGRLCGLVFGAQPSLAQPSPAPTAQPKLWCVLFRCVFGPFAVPLRFPVSKGRLCGLVSAQPKPWCGPCQSSAEGFVLSDSEAPFSAPRRLLFWSVFGPFGAAVPLRFPV